MGFGKLYVLDYLEPTEDIILISRKVNFKNQEYSRCYLYTEFRCMEYIYFHGNTLVAVLLTGAGNTAVVVFFSNQSKGKVEKVDNARY